MIFPTSQSNQTPKMFNLVEKSKFPQRFLTARAFVFLSNFTNDQKRKNNNNISKEQYK